MLKSLQMLYLWRAVHAHAPAGHEHVQASQSQKLCQRRNGQQVCAGVLQVVEQ